MGAVRLRFSELGFRELSLRAVPPTPRPGLPAGVRCGLRGGPRKPLWRGRVMSTETIQAVQALKLARHSHGSSPDQMEGVFHCKLGRLLKADLVAVLAELRRQNEWEIALQVFEFVRKEAWYKLDLSLYNDMIYTCGKNKLIETAQQLFSEMKKEGLQPDTRSYTEMIGAFLQVGMVGEAMDMYTLMKESGCDPDKLTLTILIRNLEKAGEEGLAFAVRKDTADYVDFPKRFLKEVDKKYPKRRSLKLV